jgi:hypothetical protein
MEMKKSDKQIKKDYLLKILNRLLCLCIIVMAVGYVTVVNDLTIKGFKLQELKNKKKDIVEENKKINLQAMNLQSYNHLAQKTKDLNMVAADNIDYITPTDNVMAKK